jgi:hypothetical protein
MTKKPKGSVKTMRFDNLVRLGSGTVSAKSKPQGNELSVQPPPFVETVSSSGQSLASSIGIGEFGMNPAQKGNAATFNVAVKENLFRKMKFLQGTSASLDFSMDPKSICGYLRLCCGVSDHDTFQWWKEHRVLLKNVHTDCRNNKIKMIKLQFIGKLIQSPSGCKTSGRLLTLSLTSFH